MAFPFERDGQAALNLVRIMIDAASSAVGSAEPSCSGLLNESRAEGFRLMTLSVQPDNRAPISLYEALGFRRVGEENGELRFERELPD